MEFKGTDFLEKVLLSIALTLTSKCILAFKEEGYYARTH